MSEHSTPRHLLLERLESRCLLAAGSTGHVNDGLAHQGDIHPKVPRHVESGEHRVGPSHSDHRSGEHPRSPHANKEHPTRHVSSRDHQGMKPSRGEPRVAETPDALSQQPVSLQRSDLDPASAITPPSERPPTFSTPEGELIRQFTIILSQPPPTSQSSVTGRSITDGTFGAENGNGQDSANGNDLAGEVDSAERSDSRSDSRPADAGSTGQPLFVVADAPEADSMTGIDRDYDPAAVINDGRLTETENDPSTKFNLGNTNANEANAFDRLFHSLATPRVQQSLLDDQSEADREWKLNRETLLELHELENAATNEEAHPKDAQLAEPFRDWFGGPGGFIELDNYKSELVMGEVGVEAFEIPLDATIGSHHLLRLASLAPHSSEDTTIRDAILAAIAGEQNDQAEPVRESTFGRYRSTLLSGAVVAAGTIAFVIKRSSNQKRRPND